MVIVCSAVQNVIQIAGMNNALFVYFSGPKRADARAGLVCCGHLLFTIRLRLMLSKTNTFRLVIKGRDKENSFHVSFLCRARQATISANKRTHLKG